MQINYVSNPEKADAVYKKTRSQYANYKVGLILIVLFLVGIAYDLYNMYLWINFGCTMDNIVLHIADPSSNTSCNERLRKCPAIPALSLKLGEEQLRLPRTI